MSVTEQASIRALDPETVSQKHVEGSADGSGGGYGERGKKRPLHRRARVNNLFVPHTLSKQGQIMCKECCSVPRDELYDSV